MKGIYQYMDLNTNDVVYIGRDSRIDINRRHKQHLQPSLYDAQQINRVLQNNPNRYDYTVICQYDDLTDEELDYLEIKEIMKHKFLYDNLPKFSYTIGGGGNYGLIHSDETKKKISESEKGKDGYWDGKNHNIGTMIKMSKAHNSTGYFRVGKRKDNTCKKGFMYSYRYLDENKKQREILSVNIKKLEKKVKAKGLIWRKIE